jgi:putative transposase
LVLAVVVHAASVQDRDGARMVLAQLAGRFPRLRLIWADGGYAGQLIDWVKERWGWTVAVVKRAAGEKGFAVLPRRWVVEPGALWADSAGSDGIGY